MKKRLLFLGLALLSMPHMMAQSVAVPSYRMGNHYFTKELPLDEVFKISQSVGIIKDDDGNRVVNVLVSEGFTVPVALKKYEIPRDRVKNVDQLEEAAHTDATMWKLTHSKAPDKLAVGRPLPGTFAERDIQGTLWTQDSLRGHVTVINVWYSGCGPCRKEMPILSAWKDKMPGVLFLSANFENADKVRAITAKEQFNWVHIANDTYFTKCVGSGGYPLTIVLDSAGIVRYCQNGTSERIRQDILQLIGTLK